MEENLTQASDEFLVKATLDNKDSFTELVRRYEAPLSRYITRLGVRPREECEDVLQDVFVKIYRNLNGYDPNYKFSSWAYRIAHNEAISWYRKKKVRPEGSLVDEGEEALLLLKDEEDSPEVEFDTKLDIESLNQSLSKISDKYRTVLILRYFEHKEYEEISDILRIPIGTVGTLLHRGKQSLKKEYQKTVK